MLRFWSNSSVYKDKKAYENRSNEKLTGMPNLQNAEFDQNKNIENVKETVQRFKVNKYAKRKTYQLK